MKARNFLDVERSISGRRWTPRLQDERLAQAIAERHELPEILGRVMAARGVGLDEAEEFLNPTIRSLMPQPSVLKDMEKGAIRLTEAITARTRIGIISDYESMAFHPRRSSIVSPRRGLRRNHPRAGRLTEGYGPSEHA